jgi:hypothetical protein
MGMWIVLAHGADESALWAYERLRAHARHRVELVLVEALDWPEQKSADRRGAGASREPEAGSAGWLGSQRVTAVLNRVSWPPEGPFPRRAARAEYARVAFVVRWLRSLAPVVVNPPSAQGLCGRWRSPAQWRLLAARAGLPTLPLEAKRVALDAPPAAPDAGVTVLAIGGELLHEQVPPPVQEGVRRMTRRTGTPILGLRFAGADPAAAGWRLLDATPQPDLSLAGERGVTALTRLLAG